MSPTLNGREVQIGDEVLVHPTFGPEFHGTLVDTRNVPWTDEVLEAAVLIEGESMPRWYAAGLVHAAGRQWTF